MELISLFQKNMFCEKNHRDSSGFYAIASVMYMLSLTLAATAENHDVINLQAEDKCRDNYQTFRNTSGNITSPNYPADYPDGQRCEWVISAPLDKAIHVVFHMLDLERSAECKFDYLQIKVGGDLYTGKLFCGKKKPRDFVASSETVEIIFVSDDSSSGKGFYISWFMVDRCNSSYFTCWDGTCIPVEKNCDGTRDCETGEDEMMCVHSSNDTSVCGKNDVAPEFSWDPRIVGGDQAAAGAYPWMAMIVLSESDQFLCGGTIINRDTVMTAAHCVDDDTLLGDYRVYVGRYSTISVWLDRYQSFNIKSTILHENYTVRNSAKGHDIALLQLTGSMNFTSDVRPICISGKDNFVPKPEKQCIATGWGLLDSDTALNLYPNALFQVRLPIVKNSDCATSYSQIKVTIQETQLCAGNMLKGGVDTCSGDSGGPLVCLFDKSWYQVGITSFGEGCGVQNRPGVYTRVSSYYQWIQDKLGKDETIAVTTQITTQTTHRPILTTTTLSTKTIAVTTQITTQTTHRPILTTTTVSTSSAANLPSPLTVHRFIASFYLYIFSLAYF